MSPSSSHRAVDPFVGERRSNDPRAEMLDLARSLYPICRSITGPGVRQTLEIIEDSVGIGMRQIHVPSGTQVFDWEIPPEWSIRDAYVADEAGNRLIDFQRHNLHVVNYSVPVHQTMSLQELRPHLHSLPEYPDWIPYRTTYYRRDWGFCLADRELQRLRDGDYLVHIDAELEPGVLTLGECYFPGETDEEFLISTHVCHPSLANDNLAGMVVAAQLASHVAVMNRRYSYRFLFVPGTIGTIAWLATHRAVLPQLRGGFVLALLGHDYPLTYKCSRQGEHLVDRAMCQALHESPEAFETMPFEPYGYDERQYGSPGIQIPVGCLMRSRYGGYPEYHTSADDLDRLRGARLEEALNVCRKTICILERNATYLNKSPYGEPHLGKHGLYQSLGGRSDQDALQQAFLWLLCFSDGACSLLDIASRAGLPFEHIAHAADLLVEHDLLEEISRP